MSNESKKTIYEVRTEDHWDFYKEPRIRPKIGEFRTYEEAVACAKAWVERNIGTLSDDPACVYIYPEPTDKRFDSHAYENIVRRNSNSLIALVSVDS